MKKTLIALSVVALLSGCAVVQSTGITESDPTVVTQREGVQKEFDNIPPPAAGKPVSVAVYSFTDKTGQRRPQANVASLSTAVTQGGETFLIKALQDVGRGQWFDVVERVAVDNLTKERTIIRQMREAYEGNNAKPLLPLQFAGIILEGGIIGYDTSTSSGGAGMRILGIGRQTQWSLDVVTVSLRAISVSTGKVLTTVTVQKSILSSADSATALKFYDMGTKAFEAEAGLTINEPGTYAVKSAVEMAVVELIKDGARKGLWDFKKEKANELVQTQTPREDTPKTTPAAPQPDQPKAAGREQESGKTEERREVVAEAPKPEVVAEANPKDLAKKLNPTLGSVATVPPVVAAAPLQAPPPQPGKVYTTTTRAAVREAPTQPSKLVGVILPGTVVKEVTRNGSWIQVESDGNVIGWVWKDLLKEEVVTK